jgi:hypothetical protein
MGGIHRAEAQSREKYGLLGPLCGLAALPARLMTFFEAGGRDIFEIASIKKLDPDSTRRYFE